MPTLSLLSSMATSRVLGDLVAPGALPGLPPVTLTSLGGVEVARQIRSGTVADLVILASKAIGALDRDGLLAPGTARALFRSEAVIAVPEGAECPDISTAGALRQAVESADRIGYSTGPSGDGLLGLLDRWGLGDELAGRLVQAEPGVPVGRLLAEGQVTIGIQQRGELQSVPGVAIVGSLPPGCEIMTVFSGAVLARSDEVAAATACLKRLSAPDVRDIARRHGLDLVDPDHQATFDLT
ncbi:substrate-binding domain-containing protein [Intrasporangium sp.]|uniref:substrate-binding domain-containing protein n=1 Tax=Intrasporangium sp. TaxID=1925024 RepID=UPI00293AC4F7|nr:substrate-binding domain-containing protein [Intrasporangium sp.]MDV3220877.1 substrate-binding domain-containing protein [Intrasporangium sp.]